MTLRQLILSIGIVLTFAAGCGGGDDGPTQPNPNPNPNPYNPTFDSGNLTTTPGSDVFVYTFTSAGSFNYRCIPHPGMVGVVNVSAAGQDSPVVTAANMVFAPETVHVRTGSYVKWWNTQGVHTVTRP